MIQQGSASAEDDDRTTMIMVESSVSLDVGTQEATAGMVVEARASGLKHAARSAATLLRLHA